MSTSTNYTGPRVQRSFCERLMGVNVHEQHEVVFNPRISARYSGGTRIMTGDSFKRTEYFINEKDVNSRVFNTAVNGRPLTQTLPQKITGDACGSLEKWKKIPTNLTWKSSKKLSDHTPEIRDYLKRMVNIEDEEGLQNISDKQLRGSLLLYLDTVVDCKYEKQRALSSVKLAIILPVIACVAYTALNAFLCYSTGNAFALHVNDFRLMGC